MLENCLVRNEENLGDKQIQRCVGAIVGLIAMWSTLSSCEGLSKGEVSDSPVPVTVPTGTMSSKESFATKLAMDDYAVHTQVGLTSAPTRTRGAPPIYPTFTPVLGILGGEPEFGGWPSDLDRINGWRGWVDGGIVQVDAGRSKKNPDQGLILLGDWAQGKTEVYETPTRNGGVRVIEENGDMLTLSTPDDGHSFTFDLVARKWK